MLGPDAESVTLAWRFPGSASKEYETLQIVSQIMNNGKAGLMDINLNQQQKVLGAYAYVYNLSDTVLSSCRDVPKKDRPWTK